MIPGEEIKLENLNSLIERHMPFLIRTVSNFTGRYVSIENDEEFSIGLLAFAESVKRYEADRGNFLSFAKLVIESRLKNYVEKRNVHMKEESLEALQEAGMDFSQSEKEENEEIEKLHEEIIKYREELLLFGLTLENLRIHLQNIEIQEGQQYRRQKLQVRIRKRWKRHTGRENCLCEELPVLER